MGLAVGAVGFVATGQITDEVENSVNDRLADRADQEARNLRQWDERNIVITQNVALREEVANGEEAEIDATLESRTQVLQFERGVRDMHYVKLPTNTIAATSANKFEDGKLSQLQAPWAAELGDETTLGSESGVVFDAYTDHEGTPVVAYAYPVKASSGSEVIVVTVDVKNYGQTIEADNGETTMILAADNSVVFANQSSAIRKTYTQTNFFGRSQAGAGVAEIGTAPGLLTSSVGDDYADEQYLVSYAQVPDRNLVVTVSVPQSNVYGFVQTVGEWGLIATLGGMLMIVLVGTIIGRNTATSIDRLTSKTSQMEEGNLNVDFDTHRVDNIGRLYAGFGSMRDALREQIQEARDAREEAELARAEAEQMNRHLEQKADEYSGVMQEVSAGDMTQRMNAESDSEAMADIATEFNQMIGEIEETTAQLKDFANEVATSSEEVTASSEEVRSASEQVTESIQEISDGADRQNDSLQRVSQEMSGLSTTIEEIASSSNEVADLAERTAETGRDGRDAAQEAIDRMQELEDNREIVTDQMNDLEDEMEQIDELIDFISEIAEQTNMLALNANIEAARSGSSGEGFSVVAQEVKDLAEETKDAAEDIEARLENIQEKTQRSVKSVEGASQQISATTNAVEETVVALDEIAGYAQETNTGVQEISAATEEQAASTEEVVAMVDDAATISEETSAESENVAAAAEEQTTALTEVSRSASDLANQASRLSEALDRFETDVEADYEFSTGEGVLDDVDAAAVDQSDAAAATAAVGELMGEDEPERAADDAAPQESSADVPAEVVEDETAPEGTGTDEPGAEFHEEPVAEEVTEDADFDTSAAFSGELSSPASFDDDTTPSADVGLAVDDGSDPADEQFESPGVDEQFESPGVDEQFESPAMDGMETHDASGAVDEQVPTEEPAAEPAVGTEDTDAVDDRAADIEDDFDPMGEGGFTPLDEAPAEPEVEELGPVDEDVDPDEYDLDAAVESDEEVEADEGVEPDAVASPADVTQEEAVDVDFETVEDDAYEADIDLSSETQEDVSWDTDTLGSEVSWDTASPADEPSDDAHEAESPDVTFEEEPADIVEEEPVDTVEEGPADIVEEELSSDTTDDDQSEDAGETGSTTGLDFGLDADAAVETDRETQDIDAALDDALDFDEEPLTESEVDDQPTKEIPGMDDIEFGEETDEDELDEQESAEDDMFSFAQSRPDDDE
ncbi:methyl-accepting chemotaxis protein [Haloarchaeobius sp. TZWWS8]|uniref:methyl-accepting chemotaxis protein n=1 Tax=Haloarchaeobius sp. TZWWS8 TaxID=3446121 RepID=UPI003EB6D44E